MAITSKRICAGYYEVSLGAHKVSIDNVPPNKAYGDTTDMWIARAQWTNNLYTDPLPTKRLAMQHAFMMLRCAVDKDTIDKGSI